MAERLKAHAWKACVRESVPRVRIPVSPPMVVKNVLILLRFFFHLLGSIPKRTPKPSRASSFEGSALAVAAMEVVPPGPKVEAVVTTPTTAILEPRRDIHKCPNDATQSNADRRASGPGLVGRVGGDSPGRESASGVTGTQRRALLAWSIAHQGRTTAPIG